MESFPALQEQIPLIEERLAYTFRDRRLLVLAFVHRSFYNEHRDLTSEHNERLEFLGDSVLGLIISSYLYEHLPDEPEGQLSCIRSQIVEASRCVQFVRKLQVDPFILLGKGEKKNDGRGRETILADLFEALIGALYLDGGLEAARWFFLNHFSTDLQEHLTIRQRNFKAELQEYTQRKYQKTPTYELCKEEGPDHARTFYMRVMVAGHSLGEGSGATKKEAEQAAARVALDGL